MFGYTLNPDARSHLSIAEPGLIKAHQLRAQLKNAVARLARGFLRRTHSETSRYKCPITALLNRLASWDPDTAAMHANPSKKRSRRLAILRFDGD